MILPPGLRWPLLALALTLLVWACAVVLAADLAPSVGGVAVAVGAALGRARATGRADRAIRTHTDPGPAGRAEADARARALLGRPRRDEWLRPAVLLVAGVACLVAAVLRDDAVGFVPGALLVVLAAVWWLTVRRSLLAASRWLDFPPHDGQPA